MKITKIIAVLFLLILISFKSISQNKTIINPIIERNSLKIDNNNNFPSPIGYVNDFEKIFTLEQIQQLEKLVSDYEKLTTREIAVVTISSIKPYNNMKDFTTDLSNYWKVGKYQKNNGLVLVFSTSLKDLRISTGNNTQKILTNKICKNTINTIIIPEFKQGNFYKGIKKGLEELMRKWK